MVVQADVETGIAAISSADSQRRIHQTAAGVKWATRFSATTQLFEYSSDAGATWTADSATVLNSRNASFHIDDDGYIHNVYESTVTGQVHYTRGTPSGSGWAWSADVQLSAASGGGFRPSVTAFREGTGWRAAVAFWLVESGVSNVYVQLVNITATGLMSVTSLGSQQSSTGDMPAVIDFNHTGNSKSIQGSAPHLFLVWSCSADSKVYARKFSYTAGAYTPGSIATIDGSNYAYNSIRLSAAFDGARFLIFYAPSGAPTTVVLAERNSGDTATTVRTPPALSDGNVTSVSVAYDTFGEAYLLAVGDTSDDPKYSRYSRGTATFSAWSAVEATTVPAGGASLMLSSDILVRAVYYTGTGPYVLRYSDVADTNQAPYAPAWVNVDNQAADVAASLTLDWDFLDPNTGDSQSAYALKRDLSGTVRWWGGTAFDQVAETWITSGSTFLTLAAAWGSDSDVTHKYYVRTKDSGPTGALTGVAYSPALNVVPSAKDNPTITSGPAEATATRTVLWSVATQTAYRARLLNGTTIVSDSGWLNSTSVATYTFPVALENAVTYTEEIATRNDEGLISDSDTNDFLTAFTPPPTPTLVTTSDVPTGAITIEGSNPTPGGSEPDLAQNYLERREVLDTTTSIRLAVALGADPTYVDYSVRSGVAYEYRLTAVGTNSATALSDWTP
jgi:hypothetical protein